MRETLVESRAIVCATRMNADAGPPKRKTWTTWFFYSVAFIWMAGASVWSIIATSRLVVAEVQLGTYATLAGKTHAGLSFYRGRTQLLRPEGDEVAIDTSTNGYVYKTFPAYSKWDKLYQETYNEQMRAYLATNVPSAKQQ